MQSTRHTTYHQHGTPRPAPQVDAQQREVIAKLQSISKSLMLDLKAPDVTTMEERKVLFLYFYCSHIFYRARSYCTHVSYELVLTELIFLTELVLTVFIHISY